MKIHRFYIQEHIQSESSFRSEDTDLVHQLRDVFRMKKGDMVSLFDGSGYEFPATIELLTRKEVEFSVDEGQKREEKGSDIELYMSIIKKDNFELVLQKVTELGVKQITPIIAERSQYKKLRYDRLQKVVQEASEQCGRVTLPHIAPEITLEFALEQHPDMAVLDMVPIRTDGSKESTPNEVIGENFRPSKIAVGPEGGWSEKERELFKEKKIHVTSLPFDTLRAETAAIVACCLGQL